MEKYHHDFPEVGDESPVNCSSIVTSFMPHMRKGVGDEVDYGDT